MTFIWVLLPTILYTVFVYIRLNFLKLRSFISVKDVTISGQLQSQVSYNFIYIHMLYLLTLLTVAVRWNFSAHNPHSTLYTLISLLVICVIFFVLKSESHAQLIPLGLLFSLISLILYVSTNLYQLYIILEILAYTNLLFLTVYALVSPSYSTNQQLIAMIINFILNFISSIILFTAIVFLCWYINYPTIWGLTNLNIPALSNNLLLFAVLVKLGAGPWLAGNSYSYKGYSLPYLLIYTVSSITVVLPTLLHLLPYIQYNLISLFVVISLLLFISQTLHKVVSLKALFAYSTTILHSYIILILTL